MVALDSRPSAPASTPPGPPAPGTEPPGRSLFQAFVAVAAAVAVIGGFYAFGNAVADGETGENGGGDAGAAAETAVAADDGDDTLAAAPADDGHGHEAAQAVDDRGFAALENGEQHGHSFTQPLTPEERTELGRQLALAREVAMQYPTLADAEAAGMFRAGPFSPGLGTHVIAGGIDADGVMSDDDIRRPLAYMYDGVEPTSRVAGLFYGTYVANGEGFAGPNDTWHLHKNICIVNRPGGGIDTPLGADRDITRADCDAVGGDLVEQTQYLLHAWVVPGYESPEGVFAHLSSAITCPDGTYHVITDPTAVGTSNTTCLNP